MSYNRGKTSILDRKGLEAAACRCYTKIEGLHDCISNGGEGALPLGKIDTQLVEEEVLKRWRRG